MLSRLSDTLGLLSHLNTTNASYLALSLMLQIHQINLHKYFDEGRSDYHGLCSETGDNLLLYFDNYCGNKLYLVFHILLLYHTEP